METVSVANLKQHLSHYLALVETGHEVLVTAHRRPVARVVASGETLGIRAPTQPVRALSLVKGVPLATRTDVVSVLLEDRARR